MIRVSDWVPYEHPDRLTDEVTIPVEADHRFIWLHDLLWHLVASFASGLTLKVGFEVGKDAAKGGYLVGFKPLRGAPMIFEAPQYAPTFYLQIGGTACRFFVVDAETREPLPLRRSGQPTRALPQGAVLL